MLLAVAALYGALPAASADDRAAAPILLAPLVVSATHLPAALERTPASVTVITREEIAARRPASTIELLRQVPGLHIDQPGGRGGVSSVYMRGADPNFALILIDGIEVNDPTNTRGGSFDFSTLAVEDIERVEIVRGPASAVYGSDAMAGVIQIVTRGGTERHEREVSGAFGRFGYGRAGAAVRGTAAGVRYALSGRFEDDGRPVERSRYVGRSFSGNLAGEAGAAGRWRIVARYSDADAAGFPDDSGGPRFAVLRTPEEREIQEFAFGLRSEHEVTASIGLNLSASHYRRSEDVDSPGVAPGVRDPFGLPPSRTDNRLDRTSFTASAPVRFSEEIRATLGGSVEHERGRSDGTLLFGAFAVPTRFRLTRTVYAPFAEIEYAPLPALTLSAGLRLDIPDDFAAQLSPRLGAVYAIESTGTRLKANWGRGFKLPSFFALGHPLVGNPDLKPEKSTGFDLGIVQEIGGRASLGVTWFRQRFHNLVDFVEGPPPRLENLSRVRSQGVEVTATAQVTERLSATAHLTYVDTDILDTEEVLRNRPKWRAGLGATWRPRDDLQLRADVLYVGRVADSSIPTGDRRLDDYARVDLAATWRPVPDVGLSLAVDNLLDARYEEAAGFPATGTRPRIGLSIRF